MTRPRGAGPVGCSSAARPQSAGKGWREQAGGRSGGRQSVATRPIAFSVGNRESSLHATAPGAAAYRGITITTLRESRHAATAGV